MHTLQSNILKLSQATSRAALIAALALFALILTSNTDQLLAQSQPPPLPISVPASVSNLTGSLNVTYSASFNPTVPSVSSEDTLQNEQWNWSSNCWPTSGAGTVTASYTASLPGTYSSIVTCTVTWQAININTGQVDSTPTVQGSGTTVVNVSSGGFNVAVGASISPTAIMIGDSGTGPVTSSISGYTQAANAELAANNPQSTFSTTVTFNGLPAQGVSAAVTGTALNGYTLTVSPNGSAPPGNYNVVVTASYAWTDGGGSSYSASGSTTVPVNVIGGLKSMMFQLSGGQFQPVPPTGLYVPTGSTVVFKAISCEPDGSWPGGSPTWSGTSGASGTGPTCCVAFGVPSANMSDSQSVIATYAGQSISTGVIRYSPDAGTLTANWENNDPTTGIWQYNLTYVCWSPDSTGDGQPDNPNGGFVTLNGLTPDQWAAPAPGMALSILATYSFQNGVAASQTCIAATPDIQPLLISGGDDGPPTEQDACAHVNDPSLSYYETLRSSHSDVGALCQGVAQPIIEGIAAASSVAGTGAAFAQLGSTATSGGVLISPSSACTSGLVPPTGNFQTMCTITINTAGGCAPIGALNFAHVITDAYISDTVTASPTIVKVGTTNYCAQTYAAVCVNIHGDVAYSGWSKATQLTAALSPSYDKYGSIAVGNLPGYSGGAAFWYGSYWYEFSKSIGYNPPPLGAAHSTSFFFPNNATYNQLEGGASMSWP